MAAAVLVDSNVILDIATSDPEWSDWSSEMLARVARDRTYFPTLEIVAPTS